MSIAERMTREDHQHRFNKGKSENRNNPQASPSVFPARSDARTYPGPLGSERRASFNRASNSYEKSFPRNSMLEEQSESRNREQVYNRHKADYEEEENFQFALALSQQDERGQLSLLASQNELCNSYMQEDQFDRRNNSRLAYLDVNRKQPSRAPVPQSKPAAATDKSQQPCFEKLRGKPCGPPCPYNHEEAFLKDYMDNRWMQTNESPYLSKQYHMPNVDAPQKHVRLVQVTAPEATHQSMLKPSLSTRRDFQPHSGHYSNRYDEAEDSQDEY